MGRNSLFHNLSFQMPLVAPFNILILCDSNSWEQWERRWIWYEITRCNLPNKDNTLHLVTSKCITSTTSFTSDISNSVHDHCGPSGRPSPAFWRISRHSESAWAWQLSHQRRRFAKIMQRFRLLIKSKLFVTVGTYIFGFPPRITQIVNIWLGCRAHFAVLW